jgi:hypothetical protein
MAHYGQVLDSNYDPRKDQIYTSFAEYFENPTMTKIKDVQNYSMYMTKIHALLGIEYRYIIAFVYKDNSAIGTTSPLIDLRWQSLQTRGLQEDHNIPPQSYIPRKLPSINKRITLTHRDPNQYVYSTESLPIVVTLLPSSKNKGIEYSQTGTLVTALETYNTILSWT